MSMLSGGEGEGTRAEMNALVFTLFTDETLQSTPTTAVKGAEGTYV